jgi:hypothetical protein
MRTLTFSAILLDTGELTLEPGFVVEGEPLHKEGELTVEVLSRADDVIATTQVQLDAPCGYPSAADNDERPARLAVGLVEFPEDATGLRVIFEGRTLLERSAPRTKGEAKVDWPKALPADMVSVQWQHPYDDAIASLGYSNDGGKTWSPLMLPSSEETIVFDATMLPGGRECLMELTVTDGFRTTSIRSPQYAVEPKGWVLWILSPAAGSALPSGESVLLAAQGYHLEERRASFDDITWISSLDGGLGDGSQVLADLSAGEHSITASMLGVSAEAIVTVTG